MCGRYALFDLPSLIADYGLPPDYEPKAQYNVAPTHTMPVVTETGTILMRWGLIPKWAKDEKIGYKLINARSESVFDKPIWKAVITKHRCLIPANGFYEWQKRDDGKQPFYIHPKDQSLFMFAGIWETWQHEGREWHTYSILTTGPTEQMVAIHDRMPVILHNDDRAQWLGADTREDIEPLLVPYSGSLDMIEVSRAVNVATTNDSDLILPINSQ